MLLQFGSMDRITHTQKIGHSPEDSLIIHAIPAGSVTIASQAVDAGTLVITLNTGATVSLQGVTTILPADAIAIVDPTV
ncbi:MAG: hypothetical protein ACI9PU_002249 [Ascidiaceihabitans sp.]|jgi:hypothetical protein